MSRREQWLAIVLVVAAFFLRSAFPRYDVHFGNGLVFRWDRWTGHLDATANETLRITPWATVTLPKTTSFDQIKEINGVPVDPDLEKDLERIRQSGQPQNRPSK